MLKATMDTIMTSYKSDFINILAERGFIHQGTDIKSLDALLSQECVTGYSGFDATADSLHVGHMVQIMQLKWLQRTGHRPIVLMGGATSLIGDPSWRDSARPLLEKGDIEKNINSILPIFRAYLHFDNGTAEALLLNNADWLCKFNYLEFLRDYGRYFSINRMLTFDSVKLRLDREQTMSFLEFNYMILQGYDFLELSRTYGCSLQLGGSDQWGNIINGIELTRRIDQREVFGLTSPLITTADGQKMGKTGSGAVWLNADRLAPYDFWQYWRNTHDDDVGRFLRLFTDLPLDEVKRLENLQGSEINEAKKILADHITLTIHGEHALQEARTTAETLFEDSSQKDLSGLSAKNITRQDLAAGIHAYELLYLSGLASSKGEARRLIRGTGARLNDKIIQDEMHLITPDDVSAEGFIKLSAGKKRYALIRVT
jgi:tyrosyl-tRNA synthetase